MANLGGYIYIYIYTYKIDKVSVYIYIHTIYKSIRIFSIRQSASDVHIAMRLARCDGTVPAFSMPSWNIPEILDIGPRRYEHWIRIMELRICSSNSGIWNPYSGIHIIYFYIHFILDIYVYVHIYMFIQPGIYNTPDNIWSMRFDETVRRDG